MSDHRPPVDAVVAAEYLGDTLSHVRSLTRKGAIPHFHIGRKVRYRLDDLDRWVDANVRTAA